MSFICFFFFFSSRRRHTRSLRDWSSDVCSSDLDRRDDSRRVEAEGSHVGEDQPPARSEERRVGKSVDLGGRRIIKKKNKTRHDATGGALELRGRGVTINVDAGEPPSRGEPCLGQAATGDVFFFKQKTAYEVST